MTNKTTSFVWSFLEQGESKAIQLLALGYVAELLLQCVVFGAVFLAGAKALRFKELSEAASLVRGIAQRRGSFHGLFHVRRFGYR